ncbi:MAG: sigma 54-interacting transcriptional regulator, partial [Fibrobacter sp.]|nr:sigma 54-interacting transcriptional regulator [Fibrobacter sp.]
SVPVLLLGESGTGKEVAARRLHEESARAGGAFIAVNCGALTESLAENLLEGSARGAFTGAVREQKGFVRAADRGTLFLDEIGELPLESQTRLLRIIQEKAVTPLGTQKSVAVDFRLICATNRNLRELVSRGLFREDLFFRLNVFPVPLLPLRERKEGFEKLVLDIWKEIEPVSDEEHFRDFQITAEEIRILSAYPYPGNVRQLKNVLLRYRLLAPYGASLREILSAETWNFNTTFEKNVHPVFCRENEPEWERLPEVLQNCSHNKTHAAREMGVSRGSLCYQLRKRGLS